MPNLLTPARLASVVGVLTGLAAFVTAVLHVVPINSPAARAIQAASGVIATAIVVCKFLEGQSSWETQQSAHAHEATLYAATREPVPATVAYDDDVNHYDVAAATPGPTPEEVWNSKPELAAVTADE